MELLRDGDDAPRKCRWPDLFAFFALFLFLDLLSFHLTIFRLTILILRLTLNIFFIYCVLQHSTHPHGRHVYEQDFENRAAVQSDLRIALCQLDDGGGYHDGVGIGEEVGGTITGTCDVLHQLIFHRLSSYPGERSMLGFLDDLLVIIQVLCHSFLFYRLLIVASLDVGVEEITTVDLGDSLNIRMILQEQVAETGNMSLGDSLAKIGDGLLHLCDEGLIQIGRAEVGVSVAI